MKITNEQLAALQELETRRKKTEGPVGFETLMAQQLQETAAPGVASGAGSAIMGIQGVGATALVGQLDLENPAVAQDPAFARAGTRLEGIFSSLEAYAGELGSEAEGHLRGAYQALEKMTKDIAAFKEEFPGLAENQPGLASVLNELDVLATTETFKFNRGDYL